MKSIYKPNGVSKTSFWIGIVLSALALLFLLFDSITKLLMLDYVVKATVQAGFQASAVFWIGLTLMVCIILYLIPKTSIFGAFLTTAYLGGATDAIIQAGNPLAFALFPIITGVFIVGGLWLRDKEFQNFFPIRK